jgi:small subunit ribosomal protein S2
MKKKLTNSKQKPSAKQAILQNPLIPKQIDGRIEKLTSAKLIQRLPFLGNQFASKDCNPKLYPFMLGEQSEFKVIDRDHLTIRLKRIFRFISLVTNPSDQRINGGKILLVCTDPIHYSILKKAARMTNQPYVCYSWVHGLLTNWKQVVSTKRVVEYSLAFGKFTNKKKKYIGLINLRGLPDLLLVVNPTQNIQAIREAKKMHIPVISFIDPDHPKIEEVDYWIPISCNASNLIHFFFSLFVLLPWETKKTKNNT